MFAAGRFSAWDVLYSRPGTPPPTSQPPQPTTPPSSLGAVGSGRPTFGLIRRPRRPPISFSPPPSPTAPLWSAWPEADVAGRSDVTARVVAQMLALVLAPGLDEVAEDLRDCEERLAEVRLKANGKRRRRRRKRKVKEVEEKEGYGTLSFSSVESRSMVPMRCR